MWLKETHSEDDAALIGKQLVAFVNDWWREHLQKERLTSALELEFETLFQPFFDAHDSWHRIRAAKSAMPG